MSKTAKTTGKMELVLKVKKVKNEGRLKEQQTYYKRLKTSGVAKKETYSLKQVSALRS